MDASLQFERIGGLSPLEALLRTVAVGRGYACVYGELGNGTPSLLDRAEAALPLVGVRVVRTGPSGPGGLDLPDFVSRIVRQWPPEVGGEDRLERAFFTLTVPGSAYTQVALLIDDAHGLTTTSLHYLKLTCQSRPALRIVLAGPPELQDRLAEPEFRWLRDQMACELDVSIPSDAETQSTPTPKSTPADTGAKFCAPANERAIAPGLRGTEHACSTQRTRPAARIAIGLTLAASVLVAVWTVRRDAEWGRSGPGRTALTPPAAFETNFLGAVEPVSVQTVLAPAPIPDVAAATAPDPLLQVTVEAAPEPVTKAEPEAAALPDAQEAALAPTPGMAMEPPAPAPVAAADPTEPEAANPLVERVAVSAAAMAEPAQAPLAPAHAGVVAAAVPPPSPTVVTAIPVLARLQAGDAWLPQHASIRQAPPIAHPHPERSAVFAAQRCRAIVVKTQLGEDPSDADRDFLRRGCLAER